MPPDLIVENVNVYQYPTDAQRIPSNGDITIGDLHSNVIKFLHFLIKHNIVDFKDSSQITKYDAITNFYESGFSHAIKIMYLLPLYETLPPLVTNSQNTQNTDVIEGSKRTRIEDDASSKISEDEQIDNTKRRKAEEDNYFSNLADPQQKALVLLREFYRKTQEQTLSPEEYIAKLFGYNYWHHVPRYFMDLFTKLEVRDTQSTIRLIGDELSDRGVNDIFILLLYKFLKLNGVKITTLISNHNIEFIYFYLESLNMSEKEFANIADYGISNRFKISLFSLKHMMHMGLFTKENLKHYVENYYLPTLKLIDFNLSEDGGIRLFSHAPIRFEIIRILASTLGVTYLDDTPENLGVTINNINENFRNCFKDRFNEFFPNPSQDNFSSTNTPENIQMIVRFPFRYIAWNRWSAIRDMDELARPAVHPQYGYHIYYVYGHDSFSSEHSHTINLNTHCGKGPKAEQMHDDEFIEECLLYKVFNTNSNKPNLYETTQITPLSSSLLSQIITRADNDEDIASDTASDTSTVNIPLEETDNQTFVNKL